MVGCVADYKAPFAECLASEQVATSSEPSRSSEYRVKVKRQWDRKSALIDS